MDETYEAWQRRLAKRRDDLTPWITIAAEEGIHSNTFRDGRKRAERKGWLPREAELPPAIRSDGKRVGPPKMVHPSTPETTELSEVHLNTPESAETVEVHQSTPEPQGTLEEFQDVIEDVKESVPEMRQLMTEEEHLSTPEVHPELSEEHSGVPMVHSGVPARQEHDLRTPQVQPGTPTTEDLALWQTIKTRWSEVEKLLADRQALLSTPIGTPGHTQKKTYVFDVRHIALIDRYAEDHRLDLKDVLYAALQEFFERRGYLTHE